MTARVCSRSRGVGTPCPCHRHRPRRGHLPRAQPGRVPTARSAPMSSAIRLWRCGAACALCARGLPPRLLARFAGGDRRRRDLPPAPVDRSVRRDGPFDIIGDVHGCTDELEALLATSAMASSRRSGTARPLSGHPARRAARPSSSVTSSIAARASPTRCGWSWPWSKTAPPCACRAITRPSSIAGCRPRGQADPWPRCRRSPSWTPAPSIPRSGPQVHRQPGQPLMLDGGRLVIAHAGLKEEMQGRASGAIRDLLPLRRDHRRDRRVRPASPPQLGGALSRRHQVVYGHTPVAGAGMAQQHAVHRHRLRVRRQADGIALSGDGAGVGPGGAGLSRAGPPAGPAATALQRAAGSTTTCSTLPRLRQAYHRRPARSRSIILARGERGCSPGGDESVRDRSALADLPAADHVALRDRQPRRLPGASAEALDYYRSEGIATVVLSRKSTWARAR